MALSWEQRWEIMGRMFNLHANGHPNLTKEDLKAAVDGIDDYLDTNAALMNAAIPQPARGILSNAQKAQLLSYVALKRWG
jgi:hypothetical protein